MVAAAAIDLTPNKLKCQRAKLLLTKNLTLRPSIKVEKERFQLSKKLDLWQPHLRHQFQYHQVAVAESLAELVGTAVPQVDSHAAHLLTRRMGKNRGKKTSLKKNNFINN